MPTETLPIPPPDDDEDDEEYAGDNAQEVLDLFRKLQETAPEPAVAPESPAPSEAASQEKLRTRIFSMDSIHQVMAAAKVTGIGFHGQSTLYKDDRTGKYLLVLTQGDSSREDFDRTSNMISEYGSLQRALPAGRTFLEEHYEALVPENALQHLAL